MALHTQVLLDPRLMYHSATMLIETGAQQVSQRVIPATSANNSQIAFSNILSLGGNTVLDSYMQVVYQIEVKRPAVVDNANIACPPGLTYDGANNWVLATNQRPVADTSATVINNANMCFTQFPLSQSTNSLSLSINNVETNVPLSVLIAVMRENIIPKDVRDGLLSSTPCQNNRQPILYRQNTNTAGGYITEQPNTPNAHCSSLNRLNFIDIKLVDAQTVVYTLVEPVLISPLSVGFTSHALCNVVSLSLKYNLDASSGLTSMFNCTQDLTLAQTNALKVRIVGAELYMNSLTINPLSDPIPAICYYDFSSYEVNTFTLPEADVNMTNIQQALNSFKLSTIFKMYCLKLCPRVNNVSPGNLLCGFNVTGLSMTYGSYGTFNFNAQQLYLMYRKNTGNTDVSFKQWRALGCVVYISPLDLSSSGSFSGEVNTGGIQVNCVVSYDMKNYKDANVDMVGLGIKDVVAIEIYCNQGSTAIGQGIAIFKNSTISAEEFDQAIEDHKLISKNAVVGEEGGKFNFSGLKGVLSSGVKSLGKLAVSAAVKHGPELAKMGAQAGLEALQSKLNESSGGALGVSGGRYRRR